MTLSRVRGLTMLGRLNTRETVAVETRARFATSRIFGMEPFFIFLDGCALPGLHSLRLSLDGCALPGLHSLRSWTAATTDAHNKPIATTRSRGRRRMTNSVLIHFFSRSSTLRVHRVRAALDSSATPS